MILDNLHTSLADYGGINPKLSRGIEWLKNRDLAALKPAQSIVIDGDRIFAQVQSYNTLLAGETRFEAHRKYIDIQIMVSGREIMYWVPLARLAHIQEAYNYEDDIVFFEEPTRSVPLYMEEGDFAVFFPTDGHKPRCVVERPEQVVKIVVKVAV